MSFYFGIREFLSFGLKLKSKSKLNILVEIIW